jgi:hypothetical protein
MKKIISFTMAMSLTVLVFAADFFWVGGTGSWSDINHWVTSPGGQTNHLQVPGPFDDVYFDQYSFTAPGQTVSVNAGNYLCRNMNWSGVLYHPEFRTTAAYPFRIYGSLVLSQYMNFNYNGVLYFEAVGSTEILSSKGQVFKANIYFNGSMGNWIITDSLDAGSNTIFLMNGALDASGKKIRCGSFVSSVQTVRGLNLQGAEVYLNGSWNLNTSGLSAQMQASDIYLSHPAASFSTSGGSGITYERVHFTNHNGNARLTSAANAMFSEIHFRGNARIFGNQQLGLLDLGGQLYEIEEGVTITISDMITSGSCMSSTFIRSMSDSVFAFISKSSGVITMSWVIIQGVEAVGGATFNLTNSVGIGNVPGWNITQPQPRNLYWVGGGGNWDDPLHWSLQSGGTGGACVPGPTDNVYFDASSFVSTGETVLINQVHVFCNDMIWSDVIPQCRMYGISNSFLNIFGSLHLTSLMDYDFRGRVNFLSVQPGKQIVTAAHLFRNHVTFNGQGGGWTLLGPLYTSYNNILLIKGSLNTGGNEVSCNAFISGSANPRGLNLGNSVFTLISNSPSAWKLNNTNLSFDAGTSLIQFLSPSAGMQNSGNGTTNYYHVRFAETTGASTISSSGMISIFEKLVFCNSGIINGSNVFRKLWLMSHYYNFQSGMTQSITDSLRIFSSCSRVVYLFSSANSQAIIHTGSPFPAFSDLMVRNIHVTGNPLTALSSSDLGGNVGWSFTQPAPRDLYWVGGSGNWNEAAHWSLQSGGAGGSCVPRPSDNVILDQNSFTASGQFVNINVPYAFCRNMSWTNPQFMPEFLGNCSNHLMLFGSMVMSPLMQNNCTSPFHFLADHGVHQFATAGQVLRSDIYFESAAEYSLADDLNSIRNIYINSGEFNSSGHAILCMNFNSSTPQQRVIDISNSSVILSSASYTAWNMNCTNLQFQAVNSTIGFHSPGSGMLNTGSDTIRYHNVIFSDTLGMSQIRSVGVFSEFVKLEMHNNGRIMGSNAYDTLIFYPSRTYELEAGKTQYISELLHLCGNGCFPITLRSTNIGLQSYISKASGLVSAAYVEMRDQAAIGGAQFFTGDYSTDVSNNSGWIFSSAPGYVFGLPDTMYLCPGDTALLSALNFLGAQSWQWQDQSTCPVFHATQAGKYWVRVTYDDNCFITDTVMLIQAFLPYAFAGHDTAVCPGQPLNLSIAPSNGVQYHWSTNQSGSSVQIIPVTDTLVTLTATNLCGSVSDQISISVFSLPFADLGNDTVICQGSSVLLQANGPAGASYLWDDGSSDAFITVTPMQTTTYTLSVTDENQCGTATDQTTVYVISPVLVNAGHDRQICAGQSLTLIASANQDAMYLWTGGITGNSFSGTFYQDTILCVTASDSLGCTSVTDCLNISILPAAWVSLPEDTAICSGSTIDINALGPIPGQYNWYDGQSGNSAMFTIQNDLVVSCIYSGLCGSANDTMIIHVLPLPDEVFTVYPEYCKRSDGMIITEGQFDYYWSDGSDDAIRQNLSGGIYNLTIADGNCSNSFQIMVPEVDGPVADFSFVTAGLYAGEGYVACTDLSQGAVLNAWDFGDGNVITNAENPRHSYTEPGEYFILLSVSDENGCTDTAMQILSVGFPPVFFIANAFTPNADGINDLIGPQWYRAEEIVACSWTIIDRWGEEIFTTSNPEGSWDGNGAVDGVYTWMMDVTLKPSHRKQYTGLIVLYR